MTWFGDIDIPFITSKDTSISKDVIEKNFVDSPPQVYNLTPDLESGTYSIILNENHHARDETFEEQRDAVLSMVSRHGTEFPFNAGGDIGYVLIDNASTSITPSQEIEEGEINLRFLDNDSYRSAVKVTPQNPRLGDFDVDPKETLVAFPDFLDVKRSSAGDGTYTDGEYNLGFYYQDGSETRYEFSLETEDGKLNYFLVDETYVYEYDEYLDDVSKSQRTSICRLFNSDNFRIYSDSRIVNNSSYIDNFLIKISYNSNHSKIEFYNDGWNYIGDVQLPFEKGHASENSNDKITVDFINDKESSVYRGFPIVEYRFTDQSKFEISGDVDLLSYGYNYGDNYSSSDGYFSAWTDGEHDIIIVRESNDGEFFTSSSYYGIENLNEFENYGVFVGIIPSELNIEEFARYIYNIGKRRRTFTQI